MSKKLLANVGNTVVDNYRRYYQEYEGTFITATNKSEDETLDTSRYIEVTEIWGNTVQDENNLEDIQSVGELYVDDEGNPILDDLGKEQYKIKIESCNDINAMDSCIRKDGYRLNGENEDGSPKEQVWRGYSIITVPLRKGLIYVLNNAIIIRHIYLYDTKNNFIRKHSNVYGGHKFTVDFNGYAKFYTFTEDIPKIYFGINLDYYASSKLPIPTQSHKTTILLPCQLMKVGDVYDRLYWDGKKRRYVIEKNILKYSTTKETNYISLSAHDTNNSSQTPQLIETNITEKIQLPCYSEKTHVFINSTVDVTMKVLVPYKEII